MRLFSYQALVVVDAISENTYFSKGFNYKLDKDRFLCSDLAIKTFLFLCLRSSLSDNVLFRGIKCSNLFKFFEASHLIHLVCDSLENRKKLE